jgi:hypothetical protein
MPFTTLRNFPFCPTAEPKSLYVPFNNSEFTITESSLDTTAKSMRFFWLLESLTVTIQRSYTDFNNTQVTTNATTEIYFRKDSGGAAIEPYKRVCGPQLYSDDVGTGFYQTFLNSGATKLHIETPLAAGSLSGLTDTWDFFGLTTVSADWGFYDSNNQITYVDTTLSIDVDGLTLYAKYIVPEDYSNFDSITVDDFSFFTP